jgi:RNA polymerase sigma-70 factor (ECF subfamily)
VPGGDSYRTDQPPGPSKEHGVDARGRRADRGRGEPAREPGGRAESGADGRGSRLLARPRTGDLDAFVELIGLHDRALRALAYRLLEDPQQMDDALQEAYLKAFRSLGGFEGRSAFGSWLHRIVYNVCMDQLRQRSSSGRHLPLADAGEMPDPMPDPGEVAAQRLDLATALAALPPKMRATVLLVDAEGMDYQAAAQVLGVPVGTVRSRLSQARGQLRRALRQDQQGHHRS